MTDNSHLILSVKDVKKVKRVKFIITDFDKQSEISIKNIALKHNKYKLNKLNQFEVSGADYKIKDNVITLKPNERYIELLYKEPLKLRSSIKFQFEIFTIIAVLMFLLSYKLTNYVADFKTVKEKSRIEILFLTIFFLFLFVPMSYINQETKSIQENRNLAKWKPLINKDKTINYNFGKDFDNWFSDRFNLRMFLVNNYTSLNIALTGRASTGVIDKDGMLYRNMEFDYLSNEQVDIAMDAIEKFDDFCKQNDIKLYTLIVPHKAEVQETSLNTAKNRNKCINYLYQKISQLNKKGHSVIFPLEALRAAKKQHFIFFKTDHHWTEDGAFVGYKELMKEINKDYPDVQVLTSSDFDYFYDKKVRSEFRRLFEDGASCNAIGLSKLLCKSFLNTDYRYYAHKYKNLLSVKLIENKSVLAKAYHYPLGADYKVLLLGTSPSENLTEFIPYTFKNVRRERTNLGRIPYVEHCKIMKRFENVIIEYKPDIIIFCIAYYQMEDFDKFWDKE